MLGCSWYRTINIIAILILAHKYRVNNTFFANFYNTINLLIILNVYQLIFIAIHNQKLNPTSTDVSWCYDISASRSAFRTRYQNFTRSICHIWRSELNATALNFIRFICWLASVVPALKLAQSITFAVPKIFFTVLKIY